jgi:hypothetical protein
MSNHKIVVDCTTKIIKSVALTPAEIAQRDQDEADAVRLETEKEAKAIALQAIKESAKAKLIAGEPLTRDEAAVLVV